MTRTWDSRMRGAAQKASPTEPLGPRTLGATSAEIDDIVAHGPLLAIAAADLAVAVAERTTGRLRWRSEAWLDRFGFVETVARHLPVSHEFAELALPPAGESWRRSRTLAHQNGDETLYDLVLIGASTARGTQYVTILAIERVGVGQVITDRPEVLGLIEDSLQGAEPNSVATVYVDIDRFERIVSAVGNLQAVQVLEQVSRKLSSTMRATDSLFRLQGDEFLILAPGLQEASHAEELGERVRSAIAAIAEPADGLTITASVGVAINDENQGAQGLLAAAETAVQLAKGRGRDRVVLSRDDLPPVHERILTVERQLRRAIEHRQVRFSYQPLVRLDDRRVVGAEALLRVGGDVGLSAADVVSTAERVGLMGALGVLVFEGVEDQLGDWLVDPAEHRRVMVNAAPSQLQDTEFMELLAELSRQDALTGRLGVEIGAKFLIDNASMMRGVASSLGPGVELGVDRWSDLDVPLAAISSIGAKYLKLHRNLVMSLPGDESTLERTRRLVNEANGFGLEVIGIGVEKEDECAALAEVGCDLAQGFLFSGAVGAEVFLAAAETSPRVAGRPVATRRHGVSSLTSTLGPMEKFGFVGLPNAGKSSLYNALTGGGALAAPYAFATTDPNIGVAKVFDERLDRLAAMSRSKNVVHTSVQFSDIGGLVEGASKGEGLGNRFLGGIREVDAIVYVLRAFEDPDVPGPTDPLEHLRVLEIELTLADLETLENQMSKKRKAAVQDRTMADEVAAAESALDKLGGGTPVYRSDLAAESRERLAPYQLLTNKPVLALVNIDENQLDRVADVVQPVIDELGPASSSVFGACVQLEAEAALLDAADRTEMLEGFGLGEGALPRFIAAAYRELGLRTFFTTGEKESRAWTFRAGSRAPECAGRIHSDMQRGFIRAEVIHWDDLLEIGGWSKARDVGKLRAEGKDYVVKDGDVMEIRFNV